MWQGRLFALMEAAQPTELDPRDLSTIGETDLGVDRRRRSPRTRTASPRATRSTTSGSSTAASTKLHMYELPDAGAGAPPRRDRPRAARRCCTTSSRPTRTSSSSCRRCASTCRACCSQLGSFEKLFRWRPEHGTEVICVPIDRPTEVVRFTTDAFYQWHFANAFTRGRELVVDYVRYPTFDSFYEIGAFASRRLTRCARRGPVPSRDDRSRGARRCAPSSSPIARASSRRSCPATEGREHAVTYAVFDELRAIGSIDARGTIVAHELPGDERASEPLHVDGYLLALCHKRERAFVAVYDATRIPDGPVAKIWLDHHVPITSHGTYISTG